MGEGEALRVLVADDEPLGVERLVELLEEAPDVAVVGTARNGEDAVRSIEELDPDLVFLDIQMPRMTGLDVIREIGPDRMPTTVFVTAYDRHALEAFELAAVDYLVKPYDDERFEAALRRARRRVELEGMERLRERMLALLGSREAAASGPRGPQSAPQLPAAAPRDREEDEEGYARRITAKGRGGMRVVPVEEIEAVTASGSWVEVHAGGETHLMRESLTSLEERLDPDAFLRIHRSALVRLDEVETLRRKKGGTYEVTLRTGRRLPVGRSRRKALERRLRGE